jgi:hypothetical protein
MSDKLRPRFPATDVPLLQLDFPSGAQVENGADKETGKRKVPNGTSEASTSDDSKVLKQTSGGTLLPQNELPEVRCF